MLIMKAKTRFYHFLGSGMSIPSKGKRVLISFMCNEQMKSGNNGDATNKKSHVSVQPVLQDQDLPV